MLNKEILLIVILTSSACSIIGPYLILRKMSMITDAISHTILLGIVLAFFLVKDLSSPFLILGATLMGVITVYLSEKLAKTKLLKEDGAIGIIFPLLFSIAIILVSKFASNVHLDIDSVLLGELAFTPFDRLYINNFDLGPKAIYISSSLLIINILFIHVFYKELLLMSFDETLMKIIGFSNTLLHYLFVFIVSLTAVGSFQIAGSILIITFMIGPGASAYIISNNLKKMISLSVVIGIFNGILGYFIATILDVSISGSIAVITGINFILILLFAKENGLIIKYIQRRKQKINFQKSVLLFHILNQKGTAVEKEESRIDTISIHLKWPNIKTNKIVRELLNDGLILNKNNYIEITLKGKEFLIHYFKN